MNQRLLIIFLLGFSSGLPLALITSTLQAWFAESGISVFHTGLLSLIGIPYLYKAFWAPFLDRYYCKFLGRRRSWLLVTQILLLLGFNLIAWLTPNQSPQYLAFLAFMLAFFSATQDTVIDAQRTEYLPMPEQGLGASFAVFGYRFALLIAGGLALILAHHFGWAVTYRIMGFLMLVGIITTLWSKEPALSIPKNPKTYSFIEPFRELLIRKNSIYLVLFILFFKLGEAFTSTTSGIIMSFLIQGLGFSLEHIAYINKIIGISSILLGGFAAGILLIRCSLYKALMIFGLLQALTTILFLALAILGKNLALFALAVISDNFATGMGATALVVLFMRIVNKEFTATQFSILVAISTLPRVFSGPIAGLLQMYFGWIGMYQIAFLLSLGFVPFLILMKEEICNEERQDLVVQEV